MKARKFIIAFLIMLLFPAANPAYTGGNTNTRFSVTATNRIVSQTIAVEFQPKRHVALSSTLLNHTTQNDSLIKLTNSRIPIKTPVSNAQGTRLLPPETNVVDVTKKPQLVHSPGDFVIFQSASLSATIPSANKGLVNEPSASNRGPIVFQSGNFYAVVSANGGASFSYIDIASMFPLPSPGVLCCNDQVVLYEPSRDLMFWLLRYGHNGTQNVFRLAVADGDEVSNGLWGYFQFPSPAGFEYDFLDMCTSSNYLWITANIQPINGSPNNAIIFKASLDEILAGGVVNFDYLDSTSAGLTNLSFRCTRGAVGTMYFGSHNNTAQIRLFSWPENSDTITYSSVNLFPAWEDNIGVCPGPDGKDWCGRMDGRITGAWVARGIIGFMWNASQGGSFSYPHIEVARINESDRTFIDRPTMWNNSYALAYPSASPNSRGDLGIAFVYGGGTLYPSGAVGLDDGFNGDPGTSGWETYNAASGTHGPYANEWGDYVSALPFFPSQLAWAATAYSLQGCNNENCLNPRFVVFGREADVGSVACYLQTGYCLYLPMIHR